MEILSREVGGGAVLSRNYPYMLNFRLILYFVYATLFAPYPQENILTSLLALNITYRHGEAKGRGHPEAV